MPSSGCSRAIPNATSHNTERGIRITPDGMRPRDGNGAPTGVPSTDTMLRPG